MNTSRLPILEPGDYVRDPLDGELRQVERIEGSTVYMEDGGCMGRAECLEVLLESEVDSILLQGDEPTDRCTNPSGHEWRYTGTAYGGNDESYHGEGRCYCAHCGADGDA